MTAKAPLPQLPGGPDPTQPVPRTPVDGFDLAAFATLSARLVAAQEPRASVLARAGVNEMKWLAIEKTWMLRIATALLQGDVSLGQEYDAAVATARAELATGPTRSP